MQMHLVLLFRIHWYLYRLERRKERTQKQSLCLWRENGKWMLELESHRFFKWLVLKSPYLVEAGKRVVLAFLCHPSPVVEYSSVPASWISKGHPLPGSHFFTAQFSFDRAVALSGVTRQQRWSISVDYILSYFVIIVTISILSSSSHSKDKCKGPSSKH